MQSLTPILLFLLCIVNFPVLSAMVDPYYVKFNPNLNSSGLQDLYKWFTGLFYCENIFNVMMFARSLISLDKLFQNYQVDYQATIYLTFATCVTLGFSFNCSRINVILMLAIIYIESRLSYGENMNLMLIVQIPVQYLWILITLLYIFIYKEVKEVIIGMITGHLVLFLTIFLPFILNRKIFKFYIPFENMFE